MEVTYCSFGMDRNLFVITKMVCIKSLVTPKYMLSPQVRMLSAVVHSSIRLKKFFDVKFVFLKHQVHFIFISVSLENFVKVLSNFVLFIMEAFKISSTNGPNVLGSQFSYHTSENLSMVAEITYL